MMVVKGLIKKIISTGCALVVLGLCSVNAWAVCRFVGGPTGPLTRTMTFGSIIVHRDTPVGTVLATTNTGPYNGGNAFYGCTTSWVHRYHLELFRTPSSYGDSVYNTNIDGVGIRYISQTNRYMPYDTPHPTGGYALVNNIAAQLVKTTPGAVGAGVLTNGTLVSTGIINQFYAAYASLAGTNTIIPVACSVSNTSIPVLMGNVPRSTFTGPGSQGDEIRFSIPLNCDANTRVKVSVEGNAHSSGISGLLALNATPATASGLGVRLYYNNAPVNLRTLIAVGTTVSNGPYSIPLVARYYQTDARVAAGQANSTATFTLTYN